MKFSTLLTSAAMALALSAGVALAQTTTPAPTTAKPADAKTAPATTTTAKAAPKVAKTKIVKKPKVAKPAPTRSANSLACSADADAKNLHGKARTKFRRACLAAKAKADTVKAKQ